MSDEDVLLLPLLVIEAQKLVLMVRNEDFSRADLERQADTLQSALVAFAKA